MNTNLSVVDPLAGQEVTIVVTLAAGDQVREERPALVSIGVAEQLPVQKTGTFGEIPALIDQAWTAFGVRVQVVENTPAAAAAEVVATAPVTDEPASSPDPSPPKPQARNLSLF